MSVARLERLFASTNGAVKKGVFSSRKVMVTSIPLDVDGQAYHALFEFVGSGLFTSARYRLVDVVPDVGDADGIASRVSDGLTVARRGPLDALLGAAAELAGGVTPGVGEGMDAATVADSNASTFDRVLSGLSLGVNAVTFGVFLNYSSVRRGLGRAADALTAFARTGRTEREVLDWLGDLSRRADTAPAPDLTTGIGYGVNDPPVRIQGVWSDSDLKQGLLGHAPRGLGSPDLHHAGQMPGSAIHEVLPHLHRNNRALHPNRFNQGVTQEMRLQDRRLHWWYRAREAGADTRLPDWVYDE